MGRLPPSKVEQLQKQASAKNKKSYRTKLLQQNKTKVFKRVVKAPSKNDEWKDHDYPKASQSRNNKPTHKDDSQPSTSITPFSTAKLTVHQQPNYHRSKKHKRRSNRSSHFKQLIEASTEDWKESQSRNDDNIADERNPNVKHSKSQSTKKGGYSFTTEGRRLLSKAITDTKQAQKSNKQMRKQMNADINKFNSIFTSQSFQSDPVASVKQQINETETKEDNNNNNNDSNAPTMIVDGNQHSKRRTSTNNRNQSHTNDNRRWKRRKIDIFAEESKWNDTKHMLQNDAKAQIGNNSPVTKVKRVEKRAFKTKSRELSMHKKGKAVKKRGNVFKTLSNT